MLVATPVGVSRSDRSTRFHLVDGGKQQLSQPFARKHFLAIGEHGRQRVRLQVKHFMQVNQRITQVLSQAVPVHGVILPRGMAGRWHEDGGCVAVMSIE